MTAALCVYGSLAPGESHHWVVSRIAGEWTTGTIRGYTFEITWGDAQGYQGFIADDAGPAVDVDVLISAQLESAWGQIDDFEGPGYERQVISVALAAGDVVDAHIYVALTEN